MTSRLDATENNFTLLRLLLALLVVLGHFKLLSGTAYPVFPFNLADAAVDSFFVVSGFLITGSYERCHGLWSFYVRRVFRLYPMYLCVVLLQTALMLTLLPNGPFSELPSTLRYLATNMLLANFVQYDIGGVLSGLHNPGINPSLWTLKIEIGFYLIVPLIYVATRRWGWMVLAMIFAASIVYSFEMLHLGDIRLARQLPGQLQFFVVGMALALYGRRLHVHPLVSVVIAVGFFARVEPGRANSVGYPPRDCGRVRVQLCLLPADCPTGIRHVVQRLSAAWPAVADRDPDWCVPRQTLVSCDRSVCGAWPGVRY